MLVLAAVAVAAGAALQSATGFGFALLASPLVFAAVGPPEALGLLVVLGLEVNVLTLATEGRRPRPLGRLTVALLAGAAPGALVGVALLRSLDAVALQVLVSAGVVATLVARKRAGGWAAPLRAAPLAGFAAGALSTSTNTSGPPLIAFLLGQGFEPERVRDTLTSCFTGLGLLAILALWATGTSGAVPDARLVAALVPVVAIGHVAGRPLFARLAEGGGYEPVVTGVLIAALVVGLLGATL
jgi:uncharacterized membrane protein YfcA